MTNQQALYLYKAQESLSGADSEFANGRYNNCANRLYYACFQAGIFALLSAGIQPSGDKWSHEFVPSQFEGLLIYRRKVYPTELRHVLERAYDLRVKADYSHDFVTRTEAERGMRRARLFVGTIEAGGGDTR